MYFTMNKNSLIFTFSSLGVLLSAPFTHAVTVSVEQGPSGDRIRISQEEGDQNIQSLRVSPDTLFVQVDNASQVPVTTPDTVEGSLVSGFISHNDGVSVGLGDSAFGFIQSQDTNGDILIDVYPDVMGSRWRQSEVARQAYERLEEQQALPSQNPQFAQLQPAQNSSAVSNARNTTSTVNEENIVTSQPVSSSSINPVSQNSQTIENTQSIANTQNSQIVPMAPLDNATQVQNSEEIPASLVNLEEQRQTLDTTSLPPQSLESTTQSLNIQDAPSVLPTEDIATVSNSTVQEFSQNADNAPSISQNTGHNSNLGTGIPYAPIQNETNQAQASNSISGTSQIEAVEESAPSQVIQNTGQNSTLAPIQNTAQVPFDQNSFPSQTPVQEAPSQINITQTNPSQSGVPSQTALPVQTQAPAQNINITLDNQASTQNATPSGQVAQQSQATAPSQININLAQETNIPNTQTPLNPIQNQGTIQDINITLQSQNQQIPQNDSHNVEQNSSQNLQAQEVPQDININITNKTENIGEPPQPSQTQVTQTPNQDININIDNSTTTQQNPQVLEEVEVPNVTSFTFSFSDQVESEASIIEPKEVIAKQMEEEAKVIRERLHLQEQNQVNNVQTENNQITSEAETSLKASNSEQTPTTQTNIQVDTEEPSILTTQSDSILNPAPDPVLDETGVPVQAEIVYLDEEGNVVPAPLNIPKTLEDMRIAEQSTNYQKLLEATDLLRDKPLPNDLLEEVLFNRAIALFHLNQDDLFEKGAEIIRASADMINLNPNSLRVPEALALMVPAAIATDHIGEAKYAVDKLLDQYPQNASTPAVTILLAESYLNDDEPINASKYLDILINDYPNSPNIKDAAILQTKSIYAQGDLNRTLTFLDFLDRRFDKVYITAPEYFIIRGKIEEDAKRYDKVADNYLTFYNLEPKGDMADFALDKVANAYYNLDQKDSARKILEELVDSFPQSPYRVSALMRIGENGLYDADMNLEEMFNLFNAPNPNLPNIFYNKIIEEYPNSQEAQTAKLRLAALSLWEKDYTKAADLALPIYNEFVGKVEADRALEILLAAVEPLLSLSMSEKNYEHVLRIWEKYPPIHRLFTPYSPSLRMSLGRALLNRNQELEGEQMLTPFIEEMPTSQEEFDNGLYAYSIILANAFKRQDWAKVLETTEKVEGWDLPKDTGLQRLYSTALASQNLNLPARALPIWHALAPNPEVPLYQRAYAQYFLARDAERRQNLREAYQANLDTLAMFDDLYTQRSPYANLERNRESIAALMDLTEIAGRYTESMEWLNKYRYFVPTDSPDYPGIQLREARLHKKMGDDLRWRSILEQVRDKDPESVFGKMAASELASFEMARDLNRMTTGR